MSKWCPRLNSECKESGCARWVETSEDCCDLIRVYVLSRLADAVEKLNLLPKVELRETYVDTGDITPNETYEPEDEQ